jgi:hypothetical protein
MQLQDYASGYQSKSDEELRLLASDLEDLIPEARLALEGELNRRKITIQVNLASDSDEEETASASRPEFVGPPQSAGRFVEEVLDLYQRHFLFFFKLTLPAVAVSWILFYTTSKELDTIFRQLFSGQRRIDPATLLEAYSLRGTQLLASWMIFSLLFAIFGFATRDIDGGRSPDFSRSLSGVRKRIGRFVGVSLLLLGINLVALFLATMAQAAVIWIASHLHFHGLQSVALWLLLGVLALLPVSRFGLATPAVFLDDCGVSQSMFRSDELTEGKWLILGALLAKSLIGGYVAGMSPFWLGSFIPLPFTGWFLWVLRALSIAAVSAVEPVMFIGFALLYLRMSTAQDGFRGTDGSLLPQNL